MFKKVIVFALFVFTFLFLLIPFIPSLIVTVDDTHILMVPSSLVAIKISYIHSVELMNVTEIYVIKNGSLHLMTLIWPGYGAGLSSSINDVNGKLSIIDNEYILNDTNIDIGDGMTINTTFMINPIITVNGMKVYGKEIEFRVKKLSLLEFLKISLEVMING